jgi:hypothetical protein
MHFGSALLAIWLVIGGIAARFENLHFRNVRSDIGPGNSIAPVPVPAS